MKIRYYLRGLGLGILVTAIFFMVSGKSNQTMSDEMIKARAKELGMTESVVLSELPVKESEPEVTTEEPTRETEVTVQEPAQEEATAEETVQEPAEEVPEESVAEPAEEESAASNTEPVLITVNRGEGSDTVSRRLQEAGLVADAYEYDRYLMANGYDKRIGAGEHTIPAGATWEDIAKILCNMK